MATENKSEIWKFGAIFLMATASHLFSGCDVNSIEQSSANSNANSAVNQSRRLNFAGSSSLPGESDSNQTANQRNSNAAPNDTNSAANENAGGAPNAEASEKTETSASAQTVPTETEAAKSPQTNSQFDSAAAQNQNLARNLTWAFGGKAQTGWFIYKPLICHAIGVEVAARDNDFAEGLSRWQKANGLTANGILDAPTLALFVAKWQSNRLKIHGSAAPEELQIAPTVDFYDVSRPDELRRVQRDAYAAYKKLLGAAIADKSLNLQNKSGDELAASEKFLKIVSSYRSRDYQDKLRRESPNSGRAGLAVGNSPHFTGRALDIYVGGEPVTTTDENRAAQVNTIVYLWLVKNAGKFGFKPYFYEPWHWEYAPD